MKLDVKNFPDHSEGSSYKYLTKYARNWDIFQICAVFSRVVSLESSTI